MGYNVVINRFKEEIDMVFDAEKEIQKNNEEAIKREAISAENVDDLVVPEKKDYTTAVDPETGKASETDVPHDPQATTEAQPEQNDTQASPEQQNQQAGEQQGQGQGQEQQPQQPQPAPYVSAPKVSAGEFKGSPKSFFGLDTEKGFWNTLDKKIQEALQGKSPEEVAENMAFAALTIFFDMIGNWADNNRKERKRIKKEYEEKVKAYDHDIGVKPHQKLLLFYAVLADHPEMRKHAGKPLTKEIRKEALNIIKTDKNIQNAFFDAHDALCHRDTRGQNAERNAILKNLINSVTGNADVDTLKGIALNDPMVSEAIEMSSARNFVQGLHQNVAGHQAAVNQNNQNRNILNQAQQQQQNQQQNQQQQQQANTR